MVWTAKPAAGTFSLNAGSAFKPKHLWMLTEGTGTTAADIGSGTALDMTLQSSAMWGTDVTLGDVITCASGTSRYALSATGTVWDIAQNVMMVFVCKSTGTSPAANEYVGSYGYGSSTTEGAGGIRFLTGNTAPQGIATDGTNSPSNTLTGANGYDQAMHMIAVKIQGGAGTAQIYVSIDGGAWDTYNTGTLATTGYLINRYGLGVRVSSSPGTIFNGSIAAAWVYENGTFATWDSTFISDLYNSGNPWTKFLTISTLTTKVKVLAPAAAASAASIEGVVLNAARDTVIGEFTGQTFEAALEGGEAVLKIDVADITPDGSTLTTSDTPLVVAYNTTHSTDLAAATVIEE